VDSPDLSIIFPMYNEEAAIRILLAEVRLRLAPVGMSYEIVCVDDGSSDATGSMLDEEARLDPSLLVIHFSRNFGKEAALAAGLDHARGRAAILLDSDLQHPPALLAEFVRRWQAGADVVNGVKTERGRESLLYKALASVFNRMMGASLPRQAGGAAFAGASDFKLLDREVIEALKRCPERNRFFRGLVAWVGFRIDTVPFEVQARAAGLSKWSRGQLWRYSLRNLLAFSALPLRIVAGVGFTMLLFTSGLGVWTLYRYVRGDSLAGFPTVILLELGLGSLVLTSLGVVSLYLAEMFDEVKQRPIYVCRATATDRRPRSIDSLP
jgi:glycosyltransferase involved in cell wall biosynthesis